MNTPTPHLGAKLGDIAKTVLMPGDPLRAEFIAETFLKDVKKYNTVRGMSGYTGTYNGVEVSVQASGMGCPSMGIYSYELFSGYEVENIIRIGTAGSLKEDLIIGDVVIGLGSSGNSNFAEQYNLPGTFAPIADFGLVRTAVEMSEKMSCSYKVGNIVCSDVFYDDNPTSIEKWMKMGCLAVEMESTALYLNAARLGKKALCLLTISDEILTGKKASSEDRQVAFKDMMIIALETAIKL